MHPETISKKRFLKNIHSKYSMSLEFSFIHLLIFYSQKVIQKYGYTQEVGVWTFFFFFQTQSSCCNCAPILKMVPHSLNEQKCIGELVRAGCECFWGTPSQSPLRVVSPCTLTKQSPSLILSMRLLQSWSSSFRIHHHKGPVRGSCLCFWEACHLSPKKNKKTKKTQERPPQMSIWQKRTCKAHSYVGT